MSYILKLIEDGKNNLAVAELAHRLPELGAILRDAHGTLSGLEDVFEKRDEGDDDLYDPDELDEREEGLSEDAAKILAALVHLLTAEDLSVRTTASAVAYYCQTGKFLAKEV